MTDRGRHTIHVIGSKTEEGSRTDQFVDAGSRYDCDVGDLAADYFLGDAFSAAPDYRSSVIARFFESQYEFN